MMTSRYSPFTSNPAHRDFVEIAPAVCERLLGEPSSLSNREWRWRRKGSFRLKLDTGGWSDFESGEGGGVLDLVMREERLDKAGAVAWLEAQGFLTNRATSGGFGDISRKATAAKSPYSPAKAGSSAMTPQQRGREALRWIRGQILPIADRHDHPVRNWMARRNLWRPELPLPPSMRWIPADASVFRGTHSGVGAIAFPLASIRAWRDAYPEVPPPAAVQLVCIDEDGNRADYENSQGNRVDKPKFGNARLAVWTVGDIRQDRVIICEGAADALALAAREPDPVIATLSTPRPVVDWRDNLSVFDHVTLWPDMDEADELGRRAGLDAARFLAQARTLAGQSVTAMGVHVGKDAADAAGVVPLDEIDTTELERFAQDLQSEGMSRFEALRYASTLLK